MGHESLHGLGLPQWPILLSGHRRFWLIHERCLITSFYISIILVAKLIAPCDRRLRLLASILVGDRLLNVLCDLFQPTLACGILRPGEVGRDLPSIWWLGDGQLPFSHRHLLTNLQLLYLRPRGEELARERRHVGLGAPECDAASIFLIVITAVVADIFKDVVTDVPILFISTVIHSFKTMNRRILGVAQRYIFVHARL